MYGHPTVVTLDNLICILTVVAQTDAADENMLSAPGLGPVQKGILGNKERELSNVPILSDHRPNNWQLVNPMLMDTAPSRLQQWQKFFWNY